MSTAHIPQRRPEADRALLAARDFTETWALLMRDLADSYGCTMTCEEADTASALFRACEDDATAAAILKAHKDTDCEGRSDHE